MDDRKYIGCYAVSLLSEICMTEWLDLQDRRRDPYGQAGSNILITNGWADFETQVDRLKLDPLAKQKVLDLMSLVVSELDDLDDYFVEEYSKAMDVSDIQHQTIVLLIEQMDIIANGGDINHA